MSERTVRNDARPGKPVWFQFTIGLPPSVFSGTKEAPRDALFLHMNAPNYEALEHRAAIIKRLICGQIDGCLDELRESLSQQEVQT